MDLKVARWLLRGLDYVQPRPLLSVLVLFVAGNVAFWFVALVTGDWDGTLMVFGWLVILFCLTCMSGMFAMVFFPSLFRRADEENRKARSEDAKLPNQQDSHES